jgi:hypothetical protein
MTSRRMPKYLIHWVVAFITDRELAFSFDDSQGSPALLIFFSIVMSAINMLNYMPLVKTTAYVDDVNDTTASPTPGKSV